MNKKVIVITGCSSGFGLEMVRLFAAKGHMVIATLRNPAKLESLKADNEVPDIVDFQILDVTQPSTIEVTAEKIKNKYGKIDVLINNAGFGMGGFFYDLAADDYRSIMETNFIGVINVTKTFLPVLMKTPDSRIINISSAAGLTTMPGMSPYNACKWALEAFSECLRMELKPFDVKVSLIEPGPYPTRILGPNTIFAKDSDNPASPYYPYSQRLIVKWQKRSARIKSHPREVAVLAEKLVQAKNPKFRNPIGPTAKLRYYLHRFMPNNWYQALIRRIVMGQ